MTNKDGLVKTTFIRNLHKDVKAQIEMKMEKLASQANQGEKRSNLNQEIECGFNLERKGFLPKGNQNSYLEEIDHFKFL